MKVPLARVYIEELRLSGFRAFENARLKFSDLTVLIGHNGSGKSTLLEALEFVRDALSDSLENALDRRGGLQALQHHSAQRRDLSVVLKLRLEAEPWNTKPSRSTPSVSDATSGFEAAIKHGAVVKYGFSLQPKRGGMGYSVKNERFLVGGEAFDLNDSSRPFLRPGDPVPAFSDYTLKLPFFATAYPFVLVVLEALKKGIWVYNLSPSAIRNEPPVGRASILSRNGDNAGDVLHHLQRRNGDHRWVVRHLSAIVPGIVDIKASTAAGRRLIQFIQQGGKGSKLRFSVTDMSDGTLRCLAMLLALRQASSPTMTCIEEIEDSVHPAALGVLLDAIAASTHRGQILITSHSPEALSHPAITPERARIIEWNNGRSQIFHPSPGVHEMSRPPRSVGTLLRSNSLFPAKTPELITGDIFGSP